MSESETKNMGSTILFCPLDWGLGHIARDLPLIKEFHKRGHKVIAAASPRLIKWLQTELPEIETTSFPGPEISYSKKGLSILKFTISLPGLLRWPFREKKIVRNLVEKYRPSLIISDNRYGARHADVFSVIITHQLMLKMPLLLKWLEFPLHLIIKYLTNHFNECWIPDFKKSQSLAGDLVHKYRLPANSRLIGPLSRFDKEDIFRKSTKLPPKAPDQTLAIISGPEPQRSLLEKLLLKIFKCYKGNFKLYNGKIENPNSCQLVDPKVYKHCSTNILEKEILSHQKIITRSGYTTIMDMYILGKRCLLVPTPGQTEQEYLAKYHKNFGHKTIKQSMLGQTEVENLKFPESSSDWTGEARSIYRKELEAFFKCQNL